MVVLVVVSVEEPGVVVSVVAPVAAAAASVAEALEVVVSVAVVVVVAAEEVSNRHSFFLPFNNSAISLVAQQTMLFCSFLCVPFQVTESTDCIMQDPSCCYL